MSKYCAAIVKYEKPLESVKQAVELSQGLSDLKPGSKVYIKPNIVFWTKAVPFPKWGAITTSRIVEDMVIVLKNHGIDDITIGEGMVTLSPKDTLTPAHAFKTLGYETLNKRYGVKFLNVMERPFEKIDLGDDIKLNFNTDILHSDFIVDIPVLKAHVQTVVSLGIKNLKGTIDNPSRKKCHSADPKKDLHFMIARLADKMPPIFTLIDGIYSNERGPAFDGRIHRKDILIASSDILSADFTGAKVLGYEPAQVPHLAHAAENHNRPLDLSDIDIIGEKLEDVSSFHEFDYEYVQNDQKEWMPRALEKQGLRGVSYRKYDLSMCTYCSFLNGLTLTAINLAWKGKPWDKVEILTGKTMKPTPGMNKTILLGKCIYKANRDNPDIKEMFPVKGCPPNPDDVVKALHQAGIEVDPNLFKNIDHLPGFFMAKYKDRPEFDEDFFKIKEI